jgi:bifunctional aspartokinase / homoserine dehydrogenase 1
MAVEVWKFGGASLASATEIQRAARMIAEHRGPLVVVVSALAGVTDNLLQGARSAEAGRTTESTRCAAAFLRRHRDVVRALVATARQRQALFRELDTAAREYRDLCRAVALLRHLAPRVADLLVARGEQASARIVTVALQQMDQDADYVDAVPLIQTDSQYGSSAPNLAQIRRAAQRLLRPGLADGRIPVVPGFIGGAPDGSVTTLGRGGSDLTATCLGRALNAARVVLWKDVPGILTADPRIVADARVIARLHHREAAEVAYFGAKVLHPRALIPLSGTRIRLQVRSFIDPTLPGTEVAAKRSPRTHPVKALAVIRGQSIVTVAGKGMAGVHGIAARAFSAVESEKLSVSTIFQASSESSIGFTLPEAEGDRAVRRIREAFAHEIATGLIDDVTATPGIAVLAVVGDGMVGTPGIAARVFSALAAARINVVAIAQGSSERNISFAVQERDAADAARHVHAEFQLSKIGGGRAVKSAATDLVLLGFGRVGRALADLIAAARSDQPPIRVVGLLDRSGYVFDPEGISRRRLLELTRKKDAGALVATLGGRRATAADALAAMSSHAVSRPVLVDVTSDATGDLLRTAMACGFSVVLANKRPLTESWARYAQLLNGGIPATAFKYEATVGAGLPVIDTYLKLVETGDRVLRIDGCVSGTLTYILSAITRGEPFSRAVKRAAELGYAEPDAREDLSGRDVLRKGLILARLMGYRGSASSPQNLVPRVLRRGSLDEFYGRLGEFDGEWVERVARARRRGRVLRYVVTATGQGVTASMREVPEGSALASLEETRNLISFTTRRYRRDPLVVSGPGAGPAVTAAGILNDIYSVAARR